ncbi:glycosyltransferase [Kribbella sp. NPDC051620]|uniref:glycosyltransferase n=1 Tax=Kribbella sp. NPDC051620 TaxID=3364120 RepID=UPI00378EABA3
MSDPFEGLPNTGRPLRVLALADKWYGGGPFAVNREVAQSLARMGHQVTARVTTPTDPHPLVDIQVLKPVPGISDTRAQLLRADGLPPDVDVILGHGRFSGGAAGYLRDNFYPNAKVIHFMHVTADEMDRGRGNPQQSNEHTITERALVERADLVVGVGPLLTEEGRRLARMCEKPPPVVELKPGMVMESPAVHDPNQRMKNLLVFTRTDDPLKGADIAARAAAELRARGLQVQLTMLGARSAEVPEQERALSDIAGFPVRVRGYTKDLSVMAAEIRGADLAMHTARWGDYELAPLEVAGYRVPVIVGNHTGVGMDLSDPNSVPQGIGDAAVVDTTGLSQDQYHLAFADKAEWHLRNPDESKASANRLGDYFEQNRSWDHGTAGLVKEMSKHGMMPKPEPGQPIKGPADMSRFLGTGGAVDLSKGDGARDKPATVTSIGRPTLER